MTWPESSTAGRLGDGKNASATDRPETLDALRQAVADRAKQGLAIYPQGGGTALDYGGPPRSPGVALDTRSLDQVIDYPAADMTITVEAGLTLSRLKTILAEQNQRLLVDAPEPDRATVGGVFATATTGPRRFGVGRPRDQIIGVSFVTADGSLVKGGGRVVKNVAGYDFPRLLTGSMGSLGVLTQLTLKVRPRPEASAIVWIPCPDPLEIGPALDLLNTSATRPIALELLNPKGAQSIGDTLGLPTEHWVLAVGFEDNAPSVAWQIDRLKVELSRADPVVLQGSETEPVWSSLVNFQSADLGPVCIVASLRPSSVAGFVNDLDSDRWAVQAHAGNGVVRGHWLGLADLETLAVEVDRLRSLAVQDGGNLTLSRCPTDWKDRLRVWGEPRSDWALAERIKTAFDPLGLMNPGRFVGKI